MLEALGVIVLAALAVLGAIAATAGIRLWWIKRSWRKWGSK